MFEMRLSNLVASVKEQVIPRGHQHEKALYLSFDVGLRVYRPIEISRRSFVHFILHCPYGSSVHTFFAEQDFGSNKPIKELVWENTSNHDSCWRSDGVDSPISKVYFRMAEEINSTLEAAGYKTVAPVHMMQSCYFNMFGKEWDLLDVKISRNTDEYYRHTLEIL